jgi:hypothetical protein
MSPTLKVTLLLVLAAGVLAAPASALKDVTRPDRVAARWQAQAASYARAHPAASGQVRRARLQAETRFYARTAVSRAGDSNTLGSVLVCCLILLAGAGAAAAWYFERSSSDPRVAAAH